MQSKGSFDPQNANYSSVNKMIEIVLIKSDELHSAFAIMNQLRMHLSLEEFIERVAYQREHEAYHLAGLWDDGRLCSVAGFREMTNLACGKIIYVDDLVTDKGCRGRGHGAALLGWIGDFATQRGCTQVHLDSGVQRHDAHRFYLRERMDIVYFHFMKKIENQG